MAEKPAKARAERTPGMIQELPPAICHTPDDNPPFVDADLEELLPSIQAEGQIVSGIVFPHPTLSGHFFVASGNRRRRCCEILGLPFRAELIDRPLSRAEVIRIRLPEHIVRRNPKIFELLKDICDYKAERGLATWLEVGAELGLPPSTVSRIISVRHVPPELRSKAELVCPSVSGLIAPLKDPEAMRRAFEFAATPGPDGKLPARDAVERFIEPLKRPKPPKAAKPKVLKGSIDGRPLAIGILPGDSTDAVVKWLNAVAARMAKYRDLPPATLAGLFTGAKAE